MSWYDTAARHERDVAATTGRSSLHAGSASMHCFFFLFFSIFPSMKSVLLWAWLRGQNSSTNLRLGVRHKLMLQSTNGFDGKPLESPPLANTATSALMMLASSTLQERPLRAEMLSGIMSFSSASLDDI